MILDGGCQSAKQDREYPDHSHAPVPMCLLPMEVREQILRDREAEKAHREAVRQRRMQREAERRKAVHEPPEAVRRVVTGRYDMDTGEIVTEGPIKGRQVMFTMRFNTPTGGKITVFGKKAVPTALFVMTNEQGFAKTLGKFIEENREALGV